MLAFITINCGEKVFWGGAASCRSIFVIFSRKLKALKARQNTGAGFYFYHRIKRNLRISRSRSRATRDGTISNFAMSARTEHVFLNAYRAKRYLTSRELFFNVARERGNGGNGKFLSTDFGILKIFYFFCLRFFFEF